MSYYYGQIERKLASPRWANSQQLTLETTPPCAVRRLELVSGALYPLKGSRDQIRRLGCNMWSRRRPCTHANARLTHY